MQVNPRQDDDRRPRFEFEPKDILAERKQPGAREKAIMEHGIEWREE